ncbi:hypothetical protein ABI_20610 [Asticcacaulis biprosthecium C19]|uniref:Uncharacterized protein n=1 Tax=Asticcacaulis biprosthecium C19 TaxID=715226 RepID=F4QM48_9CAUL|nr:hypothetical protein ABI_20610 [Asticcacaulis biprosthecium C19]
MSPTPRLLPLLESPETITPETIQPEDFCLYLKDVIRVLRPDNME